MSQMVTLQRQSTGYLDFSSHHPLAHNISDFVLLSLCIALIFDPSHRGRSSHWDGTSQMVTPTVYMIGRYSSLSDPTLMQVPSDPKHQPVAMVTLPYVQ